MKKFLEHQRLMDMHLDRHGIVVDEYCNIPYTIGDVVKVIATDTFAVIIEVSGAKYSLGLMLPDMVCPQAWFTSDKIVKVESSSPKSMHIVALCHKKMAGYDENGIPYDDL